MQINLGIYLTMALASAVFYFGVWLKKKVELLRKFCIPAPVAGGLLFALLAFVLNITDAAYITLDTSLQTVFMTAFFTQKTQKNIALTKMSKQYLLYQQKLLASLANSLSFSAYSSSVSGFSSTLKLFSKEILLLLTPCTL